MKFLADENISRKIIDSLGSKGVDIIPLKELISGVSDETVLAIANQQQRVLITFDSDFSELVFRQKLRS